LELANALMMQSIALIRLGETQAAQSLSEQALDICTEVNSQVDMARCLNQLGVSHYLSGRVDKAEECMERALNIFQELGDRQKGLDLLNNLGAISEGRGDYETAFRRFDDAVTIARQIGYRDGEIVFLTNRGSEQVALKNYAEAEADLQQAIRLAGITGSWILPQAYSCRAEALIGLNRYDDAFYSARQALALAEEDKTPDFIGMAWRALGMVCVSKNDTVSFSDWETHEMRDYDAEACFSRSEAILASAELDLERARTLREWARYKLKMGLPEDGAKMWQEAREIFAKLGAQMEVERMQDLPQ
jgi:tetratricopeptide (TPR) repeat protein